MICEQCGTAFKVIPSRINKARFCSVRCRADWRSTNWRGEAHPNWQGGSREKTCGNCGQKFGQQATENLTSFTKRKFCSKPCADVGGFRYSGESHPNWTGGRRKRDHRHAKWARDVIQRDGAKCRHCDASGVELHAHHVKSFKSHPKLRWDIENGLTLCAQCHWAVHSASTEKTVNSGNPQRVMPVGIPSQAGGRKAPEGVTTRSRAYRRTDGNCGECGAFISRRNSNAQGKSGMFCNKSCASRFRIKRINARRYGSIAPKSAVPERDDIV